MFALPYIILCIDKGVFWHLAMRFIPTLSPALRCQDQPPVTEAGDRASLRYLLRHFALPLCFASSCQTETGRSTTILGTRLIKINVDEGIVHQWRKARVLSNRQYSRVCLFCPRLLKAGRVHVHILVPGERWCHRSNSVKMFDPLLSRAAPEMSNQDLLQC